MKHARKICLVLSSLASCLLAQQELLNLEFSETGALGDQAGSHLPDFHPQGDLSIPAGFSGIADFGTNGLLSLDTFTQPDSDFTIEARFKLHDYGDAGSQFTMQIVGSLDSRQGGALRIGGGGDYPLIQGPDQQLPAVWPGAVADQARSRAQVSACVGAVSARTADGSLIEAFTRHCLETNVWIHLTAVWVGGAFRLYVNGEENTDTARLVGAGKKPNYDSIAPVFIGAVSSDTAMAMHFKGRMDFVRVLEGSLSGSEIRERYGKSLRPPEDEFDCHGVVMAAPTHVLGGCNAAFAKAGLNEKDSLELHFARDPDFKNPVATYRVPVKYFRYFDHFQRDGYDSSERTYWRAMVIQSEIPVKVAWNGSGSLLLRGQADGAAPVVFRVDGTRVQARVTRDRNRWRIEPPAGFHGLLLVRKVP